MLELFNNLFKYKNFKIIFTKFSFSKSEGTLRPDTQPSPNRDADVLIGVFVHVTIARIHGPSVVPAVLRARPIVAAIIQLNTN